MTADRHTSEQAAGKALNARVSASTPEVGVSGPSDPANGPQNGAQRLGSRRNLEARAFNAVLSALHKAGQWLPLTVRRAVAEAVLAELAPELDALERVLAAADLLADGTEAGFRAALAIREAVDGTDAVPALAAPESDELTAEEARALAESLSLDLYRAQDALAFVGECCDIADREGQSITTKQVREWLRGARCGRQLAADGAEAAPAPAATEATGCAHCGGPHDWDDCTAYTEAVTADQADGALVRVRELAERWRYVSDRKGGPLRELSAALNGPEIAAAPRR